MVVRRDVWGLDATEGLWNQTILAYALAFGVLQEPEGGQPRSWTLDHQAAVHDVNGEPEVPGGRLAQCQHGTWLFLPWHRAYLAMYERTLRAILVAKAFPAVTDETVETWALPYWNYEPTWARTLPRAFREAQLPDGLGPNPLASARRDAFVQNGSVGLADDDVTPVGWWNEPLYSTDVRADSFGGQVTGWNHRNRRTIATGAVEITPHGGVHNFVGDDMRYFDTAGRDPVFWLHHCNIDRIWEVWRGRTPTPPLPSGSGWDTLKFAFLDETDTERTFTSASVMSTSDLGYTYEDTSPPDTSRFAMRGGAMGAEEDEQTTRSLPIRSLGASTSDVGVQLEPATVDIGLVSDTQVRTRAERPTPARVQLHVRNLQMEGRPRLSYSVYLVGVDHDDVTAFAGQLPLFGLTEAQAGDAEHELEYTYDVTDAVGELDAQDEWRWDRARVRIVPSNPEVAALLDEVPELVIGSISFTFQ